MKREVAILILLVSSGCNRAPHAHAGFDQFSLVGSPVTLDASRSDDPDGDHLRYRWTADPGDVELSDDTGKTITATPLRPGEFAITVRVSDGSSSDSDRTTLRADFEAHAVVGSNDPQAPVLEYSADLQTVREFIRYSAGPARWPVMLRRAPNGTILAIERAVSVDPDCQDSIERYSSGGEHIETVYPRATEPDCDFTPVSVFEASGVIYTSRGLDIELVSDGTIIESKALDLDLLGARDIFGIDGHFFVSVGFSAYPASAGIVEVDDSWQFLRYVVTSSGAASPGRMDAIPQSDRDHLLVASNTPEGVVFSYDGTILKTFESLSVGVAGMPDGSVWALIVGPAIARTDSAGVVTTSGTLQYQPYALTGIF